MPGEISPMKKVVGVRTEQEMKLYTYSITSEQRVLHDEVGGKPIVIFHPEEMTSAMDNRTIHRSRDDGATGVFSPLLDGEKLEYEVNNGEITDKNTNSTWNISGRVVLGPLESEQLQTR